MKTYTVTWEIEVNASSPKVAAKQAFRIMQKPGTTATVFLVKEFDGQCPTLQNNQVLVDLHRINA